LQEKNYIGKISENPEYLQQTHHCSFLGYLW
jgi:hypothetical protein